MYPKVISEEKTLALVTEGRSIARFGDGELKLMLGRKCVSQDWNIQIQTELRNIIHSVSACMIGIPSLDDRSPRYTNWCVYKEKFERFTHSKKLYGSSFITRPDNAPWINTPAFYDEIEALWRGQEVILVANGKRSYTKEFLMELGAKQVHWVECSYKNSYSQIDELEKKVLAVPVNRVILCAGPTATCLAYRLASQGRHAIDLGHGAMFWRRYADKSAAP